MNCDMLFLEKEIAVLLVFDHVVFLFEILFFHTNFLINVTYFSEIREKATLRFVLEAVAVKEEVIP